MGLRSSDDVGWHDHLMMPKREHEEIVAKLKAELSEATAEASWWMAVADRRGAALNDARADAERLLKRLRATR